MINYLLLGSLIGYLVTDYLPQEERDLSGIQIKNVELRMRILSITVIVIVIMLLINSNDNTVLLAFLSFLLQLYLSVI